MTHPAQSYHQLSVEGATPLGLVAMLYDGAITALLRAVDAIEAHDIEKKCQHLNRALASSSSSKAPSISSKEAKWPEIFSPFMSTRAPKS